ncbi:glycosyl transferase family 2 [Novimethylophilus kurashikiensis]|uniref:Glycosyl transferase family 2 n=1 Tax=Novimethylophilus kurashikiensis TaxID=1825523 RepID=A0A2R5FCV8_9PROT|nr:PIG-L family deacetylase [Novimethylophilus kurashikiensis]GBG15398.1 glycosyl transferase family 2 [Novimethylophilus kurashikiensis]
MLTRLGLSRDDRILILAVHPDDETLGAAGLMQHAKNIGADIKVIFITNGDNNPWPQRLLEKRWRIESDDRRRWGRRRKQEALTALENLGLSPAHAQFWNLPDQGMTELLMTASEPMIERLAEMLALWRPTLLVAPSLQDTHPDHNAVAVLADLALKRAPVALQPRLLAYLVHGRQVFTTDESRIALSAQQQENKHRAILSHYTQVVLSRSRFLRFAQPQETFLHVADIGRFQSQHPLQEVTFGDHAVQIRVRMRRWLRWFGKPALSLIGATQGMPSMRLRISRGVQPVMNAVTGESLGEARVDFEDGVAMVELSRELMQNHSHLYCKLERRGGMFDLAGWRPAMPAKTRASAPVIGIIPCYNVAEFCEPVIRQTMRYVDHLIVIDDGSADETGAVLARLKAQMAGKLSVLTFPDNRGKGVGLMAGFCEALNRFDFEVLVTLDGDGQHPPAEIPKLVQAIRDGADMAIGGRDLSRMPARSKFGNTVVSSLLHWLHPHAPEDTQSGLRAFNREFTETMVRNVTGSRYETEIQVLLLALSQRRKIVNVPIPTIYIDNNRSSKFRPVTDSVRILYALLGWELNHSGRSKS